MTNFEKHAKLIAESDGDLSIVTAVSAYFKWNNDLVILLEHTNLNIPARDYNKEAIVDSDDAKRMAKHLHVETEQLPDEFYRKFKDTTYCAAPSEIEDIFRDILNFILHCGVRYRLK